MSFAGASHDKIEESLKMGDPLWWKSNKYAKISLSFLQAVCAMGEPRGQSQDWELDHLGTLSSGLGWVTLREVQKLSES